MRYVLKKVGKGPVVCYSDGPLTLEDMQRKVDGFIEVVRIQGLPQVNAVCHEEGMFAAEGGPLPANACGLLGDFLVLSYDGDGNQRNMTDGEILAVGAWIGAHWHQKHPIYGG